MSASTAELQYPAGLDTTTLPDGIASWHEQRNIQILWLISSIVMVVLDVVGLDVGFLAGLLGITGASLAVCNCCQFTDLRGIVRVGSCQSLQPYEMFTALSAASDSYAISCL